MAERRLFSKEEKKKILSKTGSRCAHCGKLLTLDSMTVEHTIPISKGGSNNLSDLVALCEDCNKEKGAIIVDPVLYYPYVKQEYVKDLCDSYNNYLSKPDRVSRRNILSVDMFKCDKKKLDNWVSKAKTDFKELDGYLGDNGFNTSVIADMTYKVADGMTIKRAVYSDLDELYYFYLSQYRKTYGYDSGLKDYIKELMTFTFNNGCLYFIRNKAGDIVSAFCIHVTKGSDDVYCLWLYNVELKYIKHAGIIYDMIVDEFLYRFCKICNFDAVPILFSCRKGDKNSETLLGLLSGFDPQSQMNLSKELFTVYSVTVSESVPVSKREEAIRRCLEPDSECQVWLRKLTEKFS